MSVSNYQTTVINNHRSLCMQELYSHVWGANLFRLVHNRAERMQQRLYSWCTRHVDNRSLHSKLSNLGTEDCLPMMTQYMTRAATRVNEGKLLLRHVRQTEVQVLKKMDKRKHSDDLLAKPRHLPFKDLLEEITTIAKAEADEAFLQTVALVFVSTILYPKFRNDMNELANLGRMSGQVINGSVKSLDHILQEAQDKYNDDATFVLDTVRCMIVFHNPDM